MKKIVFILILVITLQVPAQEQPQWVTDYKIALNQSKTQNKPILAFVTDYQKTEASELLNTAFFSSEDFENLASKVVLLKLDISDNQSYNVRLAIHYLNKRSALGLALVNKFNDKIGEPLTEINAESLKTFISFVNSKL